MQKERKKYFSRGKIPAPPSPWISNGLSLILHMSLIFKICKDRVTRIVVEGEPGSGKTTFMKAVCRAWTHAVQQESTSCHLENENSTATAEGEYFTEDSILLAFILRQVTKEHCLFDLIVSQFPFLTCSEVYSLLNQTFSDPDNIFFFFDGFDELKNIQGDQILDLITGKQNDKVSRIITTRSQGIIQLQRHNLTAIQAHVKICGFNEGHITQYIDLYFNLKPELASTMKKSITEKNLWKLASVPIRLQMMCFVWKIYRKLGSNMAELYKMLLMGLLDHMEKRNATTEESEITDRKDIMARYHKSILLPTANLANRWDDNGNLNILFPFSDIKKITGENFHEVTNFGCITKYFSTSTMMQTVWNFFTFIPTRVFCGLPYG